MLVLVLPHASPPHLPAPVLGASQMNPITCCESAFVFPAHASVYFLSFINIHRLSDFFCFPYYSSLLSVPYGAPTAALDRT
jgi:hypothetical protein